MHFTAVLIALCFSGTLTFYWCFHFKNVCSSFAVTSLMDSLCIFPLFCHVAQKCTNLKYIIWINQDKKGTMSWYICAWPHSSSVVLAGQWRRSFQVSWATDPTCLMTMSLTSSAGTRWTCRASGRAGGKKTHRRHSLIKNYKNLNYVLEVP